ncbi:MAG: efflux RND transporter periplasmic adaptor subunit [Alphaproteobacteria bacterium]|nr:MAG: efflux RND transporter periplasmic adaptor subunit [Alphaproteobacteria bacterium]
MRIVPMLTALLVAAGIVYWVLGANAGADAPVRAAEAPAASESVAPVPVVAVHSRLATVSNGIVLRGRTEAFRKVTLRAQVSGLIVSEPLRAGAAVKRDDVLCNIDPGERLVALEEARAWLEDARAKDEAARALSKRGYAAETAAKAARAQLETAITRVRRAELEIARLKIRAPFDGLLETDAAEIGTLMQPGAACATLIALDPIKLVGFVPENRVGRVSVGARAIARLSDGQQVVGKVTFVARSADEQTRTFRVEVTAPNPDNAIRDGLTAEILLEMPGEKGHLLPQSALTLDDDGRLGVRIVEQGKARFQPVTIIRDAPEGIWVSGLPDAADVIVVGQEFVSDGREVAVTMTERSALK